MNLKKKFADKMSKMMGGVDMKSMLPMFASMLPPQEAREVVKQSIPQIFEWLLSRTNIPRLAADEYLAFTKEGEAWKMYRCTMENNTGKLNRVAVYDMNKIVDGVSDDEIREMIAKIADKIPL